jgi:hypothetical protein
MKKRELTRLGSKLAKSCFTNGKAGRNMRGGRHNTVQVPKTPNKKTVRNYEYITKKIFSKECTNCENHT